jgi:hypothetical protein
LALVFSVHVFLTLYIFLKLFDFLLNPLDYFLDDYDGPDPANVKKVFWSCYKEGRTIEVMFLDYFMAGIQSKEGFVAMECSENHSWTSIGDHYAILLGI